MTLEDTLKEKQAQEEIARIVKEKQESLKEETEQAQFIANLNKIRFEQEESALLNKIKLLNQIKELTTDDKIQLESSLAELAKIRVQEENRIKSSVKMNELRQKEEKRVQQIKDLYFGLVKADEKRLGFGAKFKAQLEDIEKISKTISKEDARATLAAKLTEAGLLMLTVAFKQGKSFNNLTAELNKATNTSDKYNDAVRDIAMTNARLGVSAADAIRAITSLHNEFSEFSGMSKEVQTDLANTATKLEKAGIAADTTAKFLNMASKSMGMGAQEAAKYEKELVAFAHVNGISTKAINDGLASTMPRLAAFGKQGPAIFKDMAFRSKALGIEMDKLLDITERFTTFEGAAEAAGELNSVLGGNYVDSLGLLKAASEDPIKAQDMLRDALQKTGKSFDQLSGQQRRMFADILGTDINSAGAFFKKTSLEAKQAADAEKTFNDAVASFTPIGDKLTAILAKMAPVFQFVSAVIGTVVDVIADLLDYPIIAWGVGLVGIFLTIVGAVSSAGAVIGGFLLTMAAQAATVASALGISFGGIGASAAAAGTAIAAAGAEAELGGAGFAAAGAETEVGAAEAAAGLVGFTAAVTPLIPALLPIAAVLLALAAAFLAVSLPIALILAGVIGIVLAIGYLFKILIDGGTASLTAAVAFGILAASLYGLATALGTLGTIGSAGLFVLEALAGVMLLFGMSFLLVGQGIQMAKEGFDAITNFEITKLENIRNIMSQMADYMERVATAAAAFSLVMMNPLMMPIVAAAVAVPTASTLTNNISSATKTASEAGSSEKPINVNLTVEMPITLDGKELDRKIVNKIVHVSNNPNASNGSRAFGKTTDLKSKDDITG